MCKVIVGSLYNKRKTQIVTKSCIRKYYILYETIIHYGMQFCEGFKKKYTIELRFAKLFLHYTYIQKLRLSRYSILSDNNFKKS